MVNVFDLSSRSLYLCVGVRSDMATFLPAVLRGGVDIVQLREKVLSDEIRIAQAAIMISICRDFSVPFIMNDSPEMALRVGADGVHVGQDDVSVDHCRDVLGDESIVGLSTHADAEFDAGLLQPVTYLSAGPIVETPTKAGRPGTGVDYARSAQARSSIPVFVTGGVTDLNVTTLVEAGLQHFVVVRHLSESSDPETSTRNLRRAIDGALDKIHR